MKAPKSVPRWVKKSASIIGKALIVPFAAAVMFYNAHADLKGYGKSSLIPYTAFTQSDSSKTISFGSDTSKVHGSVQIYGSADQDGGFTPSKLVISQTFKYYTEPSKSANNVISLFDKNAQAFKVAYDDSSNTLGFKSIDEKGLYDSLTVGNNKPFEVFANNEDPLTRQPLPEFTSWNTNASEGSSGSDKTGAYKNVTATFSKTLSFSDFTKINSTTPQNVEFFAPLGQVAFASSGVREGVITFVPGPAEKVQYEFKILVQPFWAVGDTTLGPSMNIRYALNNPDNAALKKILWINDGGRIYNPTNVKYDLTTKNPQVWVQNTCLNNAGKTYSPNVYFRAWSANGYINLRSLTTGDTLNYELMPLYNQPAGFLRPVTPRADMNYFVYPYVPQGNTYALSNNEFMVLQYYLSGSTLKTKALDTTNSYTDSYGFTHTVSPADSISNLPYVTMSFGKSVARIDAYFNPAYPTSIRWTDKEPPFVVSTVPPANAVDVGLDCRIIIRFSEKINPSSINENNFDVACGGWYIPGQILNGNMSATFVPTDSLKPGTEYTVSLRDYADVSGNWQTKGSTWIFTTRKAPDTAGVEEPLQQSQENAFPNPANDITTIPLIPTNGWTVLTVTNTLGQTVLRDNIEPGQTNEQTNFGEAPAGVYLYTQMKNGQVIKQGKFVKK